MKFVQTNPATHAVGPVQPVPPHCPYATCREAVEDGAEEVLEALVECELTLVDVEERTLDVVEVEERTLDVVEVVECTLEVVDVDECTAEVLLAEAVVGGAVPAVSP